MSETVRNVRAHDVSSEVFHVTFANLQLEQHDAYLKKADEFYLGMQSSVSAGRWSAVGLYAVKVVTSSSNALTSFFLKRPSVTSDESSPESLLRKIDLPHSAERIRDCLAVLSLREEVERGHALIKEKQALAMAEQAERFYKWAKANLPKTSG